jgi:hypothetical protein
VTAVAEELVHDAEALVEGYAPPEEDRPLAGYVVAMGTYLGIAGVIGFVARRQRRPAPTFSGGDVVLFGLATQRASRLVAKDAVTSPIRAPFARYKEPGLPGELNESVRVDGTVGHAVGELLTCPFCVGQWVASAFVAGAVFAPRATRAVATVFAAVGVSDFLQFVYAGVTKLSK